MCPYPVTQWELVAHHYRTVPCKAGIGVRVRDPRRVSPLRAGFQQDPAVLQSCFPVSRGGTRDKREIRFGTTLQLWESQVGKCCVVLV